MSNKTYKGYRRQAGAALITTLILLTIVTLLAIAAMRSTSFGFIQAGNDQLRERAFVASETGIEQAIAANKFDPNVLTPVTLPTGTAASGDSYAVTVTQVGGAPQGALFGSSWAKFSTYQFQIVSTGTSLRSSTAVHSQGVAVLAPSNPSQTGGTGGL